MSEGGLEPSHFPVCARGSGKGSEHFGPLGPRGPLDTMC